MASMRARRRRLIRRQPRAAPRRLLRLLQCAGLLSQATAELLPLVGLPHPVAPPIDERLFAEWLASAFSGSLAGGAQSLPCDGTVAQLTCPTLSDAIGSSRKGVQR